MKCLLVRSPAATEPQVQVSTQSTVKADNVLTLKKRKTEVDEYLELYADVFSMIKKASPTDLLQLVVPQNTLVRCLYFFPFVEQIDNTQIEKFEKVDEVDMPDDFCETVKRIAILNSECVRLTKGGPLYFKKNFEQNAMAPVFPKPYDTLMSLVLASTHKVAETYGKRLFDLKVLPTFNQ